MDWSVKNILAATGGHLLYGSEDRWFQNVAIDSRTISPSALFVALRGDRHDAHAFVAQVIEKGVKGVVVEARADAPLDHSRWQAQGVVCITVEDTTQALGALARFQRLQWDIPVVAVTGSNGKTTTRQMTMAVMARKFKTLATEGNLNNEIGLPLTLFKLDSTHQAAVLELGINHFGEMDRLAAICRPTMGLITNVGPAHLEFLGNLQGVARAKGELLAHIDPKGCAILNSDDAQLRSLASRVDCPVVFFGTTSAAQVRADTIAAAAGGVEFDLVLPGSRLPVRLATPGRFMVLNALAAAAVGHSAGVDPQEIKAGLESFQSVSGRLSTVKTANGVKIIDDTYNANPASMAEALRTFSALHRTSRGFVVLGDMLELGAQAKALHRQVGTLAGGVGAAKLYAFGDYAREVVSGARQAGMADSCLLAGSKEEISADLIQQLQPEDWLLVKGSRGMAMETVVKAVCEWADGAAGE